MIAVSFGTATKRINSTARPAMGASFSVAFKNPCSMDRPVFILQAAQTIINYNYFYMLGRYYWITDCISIGSGRWEVHGEIDALATLRTEILASSAYIKYAATGYNIDLPDTRLSVTNKPIVQTDQKLYFGARDPYYILTAAGATGGLVTYALKENSFQQLLSNINNYQLTSMPDISTAADVMTAIKDFGNQLARAFRQMFSFGSCLDAVVRCVWIPYAPSPLGSAQTIWLGDYNTGIPGYIVEANSPVWRRDTIAFTLQGDWRDYAPYSRFSLYLPYVGVIQLPNAAVIDAGGSIAVDSSYAPETGEMAILVREDTGRGRVITSASSVISADIRLTRNSISVMGIAGNAARALTGDWSAIPALAQSCLDHQLDSSGSLSTMAALGLSDQLIAQTELHLPPAYPANIPVMGHPVEEVGTLSTYAGGYVQTDNMHITGSTESRHVTAAAESACNGGVYLE